MRSGVGAVATDLDIFAATSPPRVQVERPCLSPGLIRMSRHEAWAEASQQVLVEKWLLVHRDLRAPRRGRSWNITHFQRVDSERPSLISRAGAAARARPRQGEVIWFRPERPWVEGEEGSSSLQAHSARTISSRDEPLCVVV